jgi:hypothetical protein
VFENRVLRIVFGPKRDEVTGEWRKLRNEELNALYSLPNIVWVVKSRRMRRAGPVAHMGEERGVHRVLVGKPERKRPLGTPRCRWEDNIKMDKLRFVPCFAGLCIEKPTLCTGFRQVFIFDAAPTCFSTYVPSSGSVFVLVSMYKLGS